MALKLEKLEQRKQILKMEVAVLKKLQGSIERAKELDEEPRSERKQNRN